jgi:uncharacterized iron-regulated membrane protein
LILRLLDLVHRWLGGLIGLVLAVLGLTGTLLLHKTAWIALPHADDAQRTDAATIAAATERLFTGHGAEGPQSIIFASHNFGLHRLSFDGTAGLYADQNGEIVTRWASQWERPELWLFDLHHHLFTGDVGETVTGIAGLCALLFVVSGAILWWRTRRTFRWRLLPKRLSRPAIVSHHRDLGIIVAPLLFVTALTGTMMIFRPFAEAVVAPFSPSASVTESLTPPRVASGPLAARPDWQAMFAAARARFPDGEFRIVALPRRPGDPISLRMRRAAEWLPNGRTLVLFDAATGAILYTRDALAMAAGPQLFNAAYPVHSGKVGGLAWRLVLTLAGLALTLLGTLATWTFWFRRPKARRAAPPLIQPAE